MANTITETRKTPGFRIIRSTGTVVLSGSYATGGETLVIPKPFTTKNPNMVRFNSKNGNLFQWDAAAQKMKAFSAPGTELGAGAYGAGYTGDTIEYDAEFPRGG